MRILKASPPPRTWLVLFLAKNNNWGLLWDKGITEQNGKHLHSEARTQTLYSRSAWNKNLDVGHVGGVNLTETPQCCSSNLLSFIKMNSREINVNRFWINESAHSEVSQLAFFWSHLVMSSVSSRPQLITFLHFDAGNSSELHNSF